MNKMSKLDIDNTVRAFRQFFFNKEKQVHKCERLKGEEFCICGKKIELNISKGVNN